MTESSPDKSLHITTDATNLTNSKRSKLSQHGQHLRVPSEAPSTRPVKTGAQKNSKEVHIISALKFTQQLNPVCFQIPQLALEDMTKNIKTESNNQGETPISYFKEKTNGIFYHFFVFLNCLFSSSSFS